MTSLKMDTFFINAHCKQLRLRRIGPGEAHATRPPLLFLHEGLGCIEMWKDFPARLCDAVGSPGILYDRLGYGGSEPSSGIWPRDYLVREATEYLPAVLDVCGADRVIPVGHSDGGTIALLAAALIPGRIEAVITEAAHIFIEEITIRSIRAAVSTYERTNLREKLANYHGDKADAVFWRWADTWLHPDFRDWNMVDELPKITCPLLVMQGEADEYGSAAQVGGIAAGVSGPVETAMIPDCRHVPHLQATEAVLARMSDFIRGQSGV